MRWSRLRVARPRRPSPLRLDGLGARVVPAVTASFTPGTGFLQVLGDDLGNTITVARTAAGRILVNGGAVAITGGTPTVATTTAIVVNGQGGNDTIAIHPALGTGPAAFLHGGDGNDVLVGGAANDQLFGEAGDDSLRGLAGSDSLFGGDGNDILFGGDGDDQAFGEAGDDRIFWNPGDDTDLNEGGDGTDTVEVNGGSAAEQFTATANGTRVRFDRVDPAPFSIDIGTSENLVLNANGGNDSFSATGNLAALIQITVDGGTGDDSLLGSNGRDLLFGGPGNDFIDGQQSNDSVFLGAGDDTFQWDPGDASDTVEGQAGTDRLLFNGNGASESFEASANGGRVRFTRSVANIVMDLDDVERVELNMAGAADTATVNDLTGTDLAAINVNLTGTIGGAGGDGQTDTVNVNGTNGKDHINVIGSGTGYAVIGLRARVTVTNVEAANDTLVVNALGGDDVVFASILPAGIVKLTIDGGAGNDNLNGSPGDDFLLGGEGNDLIDGRAGNDVAFLGAGADAFVWNNGDGNDTLEGQSGADTMRFNGSNAAENIDIAVNGARVRFTRDVASVFLDLDDIEAITFRALGGADNVVVGDLTGTDVTDVTLSLAGATGTGDGQADTVTINATNGADVFAVAGSATAGVTVTGLSAKVTIARPEGANDRLTLNAQGGADVINASALAAGVIGMTHNGGLGADQMIGSPGKDLFVGGDGDDVALMGAGDDTFVWNPGDDNDTLEGQAGFDTMLFNGANVSERIDIAANGGRVRFLRDVASVTMDLNDTEAITFNALGGVDTITVNDLSGTDVKQVNLNLSAAGGGGDGAADRVIVNGTTGDDLIGVSGVPGGAAVTGLAARVTITGPEPAFDRLTVNALGGNDRVNAANLPAGRVQLTADGGAGNDVLVGSAGDDVLSGGDGDDTLTGKAGTDVLDGGAGNNAVVQ